MASEKFPQGIYLGRGVEGSAQHSHSSNGTEQVVLNLEMFQEAEGDADPIPLNRILSTFLYFSDAALDFSLARLRAMGWDGESDDFSGISANFVKVRVKYDENPKKPGELSMKVDILVGDGTVKAKNVMDEKEKRGFMSRVKKAYAQQGGGSTSNYPKSWDNATSEKDKVAL